MKKNKKCRSKASRKRKKVLERHPELKASPFIASSDVERYPQINEMAHSYRVCDLGSLEEPGLLSLSLASYVKSLRERLVAGERVKPNLFLQFGYSYFSVRQWQKRQTLHASGGTNFPTMELALLDAQRLKALICDLERSVRETIARFDETSEETIKTMHFTVDETDEEQDPCSGFGAPAELIDPESRFDTVVSV